MISIFKNKKALFLDRDGILNYLVNNRPPWLVSEIKIYSEAFEILKLAKESNYLPIVITNQPDAGRGKLSYKKLDIIHKRIMKILSIDHSYVCSHPYDGMCDCRKPLAGSFYKAQFDNNIDFKNSIMIGDREKDIIPAKKVGCRTIKLSEEKSSLADFNVKDHYELINLIKNLM